jgi:hypothetical protein
MGSECQALGDFKQRRDLVPKFTKDTSHVEAIQVLPNFSDFQKFTMLMLADEHNPVHVWLLQYCQTLVRSIDNGNLQLP